MWRLNQSPGACRLPAGGLYFRCRVSARLCQGEHTEPAPSSESEYETKERHAKGDRDEEKSKAQGGDGVSAALAESPWFRYVCVHLCQNVHGLHALALVHRIDGVNRCFHHIDGTEEGFFAALFLRPSFRREACKSGRGVVFLILPLLREKRPKDLPCSYFLEQSCLCPFWYCMPCAFFSFPGPPPYGVTQHRKRNPHLP